MSGHLLIDNSGLGVATGVETTSPLENLEERVQCDRAGASSELSGYMRAGMIGHANILV